MHKSPPVSQRAMSFQQLQGETFSTKKNLHEQNSGKYTNANQQRNVP